MRRGIVLTLSFLDAREEEQNTFLGGKGEEWVLWVEWHTGSSSASSFSSRLLSDRGEGD